MPISRFVASLAAPQRRFPTCLPGAWRSCAAGGAVLAALLGLSACSPETDPFNPAYDPLVRQGLFQPGHTNRNNLTLMVANPSDLVRGTGTTTSDGQQAAAAVERWRNDKVKKLPSSDLAQVTTSSSGDNNSSSGGGGGGGAGGQ